LGDRLLKYLCLDEFEVAAKRILPKVIYEYIAGGCETDATMRRNRAVFDEYAFVPRVLVDIKDRSQKTELFGRSYAAPFGVAPMGGSSLAAYHADLFLARAASAANIPMIQSGMSLIPLEEGRAAGDTAWFQAYLSADLDLMRMLIAQVAKAGFEHLVVTVDVPVQSNREYNVRNGYSSPVRPQAKLAFDCMMRPRWLYRTFLRTLVNEGMPKFHNLGRADPPPLISRAIAPHNDAKLGVFSWDHLRLARELWPGKLILKGLLNSEDVRLARDFGVDGVIVSNHGGRQLDGAAASLRVLPQIVSSAGDMTVMIDGGFRRGTDVLKALALGAKFVFVGRPFLFAATVGGEAGIRRAMKLMNEEISRDMALLGVNGVQELGAGQLVNS
jgi:L-lactate dehydrogenase (cytochrome)